MNGNMLPMIMQMLSSGNNPNQLVQQLMQNNPQMNSIANQMRNSGMPPKDFLMQYAQQNGKNIQPLLDMLSKRGINL